VSDGPELAGQPKLIEMKVIYDETPEQMVQGVAPLLDVGVNILGACCGSTPDHIRQFRKAIDLAPLWSRDQPAPSCKVLIVRIGPGADSRAFVVFMEM